MKSLTDKPHARDADLPPFQVQKRLQNAVASVRRQAAMHAGTYAGLAGGGADPAEGSGMFGGLPADFSNGGAPAAKLPGLIAKLPGLIAKLPVPIAELPGLIAKLPVLIAKLPGLIAKLPAPITELPAPIAELPGSRPRRAA